MQLKKPYRTSHRLRLPGAYYVTICTDQKRCLFGTVRLGEIHLNRFGDIVREEWLKTLKLRPGVKLDEFTVIPNHFHGILILERRGDRQVARADDLSAGDLPVAPTGPRPNSLGAIIGNFKGAVTGRIRRKLKNAKFEVWQRGFFDHIIWDDDDWTRIRAYIRDNPRKWASDHENPFGDG